MPTLKEGTAVGACAGEICTSAVTAAAQRCKLEQAVCAATAVRCAPDFESVSRKRRYCRRLHFLTMTRWISPSERWPYLEKGTKAGAGPRAQCWCAQRFGCMSWVGSMPAGSNHAVGSNPGGQRCAQSWAQAPSRLTRLSTCRRARHVACLLGHALHALFAAAGHDDQHDAGKLALDVHPLAAPAQQKGRRKGGGGSSRKWLAHCCLPKPAPKARESSTPPQAQEPRSMQRHIASCAQAGAGCAGRGSIVKPWQHYGCCPRAGAGGGASPPRERARAGLPKGRLQLHVLPPQPAQVASRSAHLRVHEAGGQGRKSAADHN